MRWPVPAVQTVVEMESASPTLPKGHEAQSNRAVLWVSNRVSRRQANRWADQDEQQYQQQQQAAPPPAPPAPAASGETDTLAQLKQLGELHEQGVLTDEEFAAQKAKILG